MPASALPQTAPGPMVHALLHGTATRFQTEFRTRHESEAEAYLRQLWGGYSGTELAFGSGMTVEQQGFEFAGLKIRTTQFGAAVSGRSSHIADDPGLEWIFLCNASTDSHARYQALELAPGEAAMMRRKDFTQAETTPSFRGLSLAIADADLHAAHGALHGSRAGPAFAFERKLPAGHAGIASVLRVIERLATTPRYPHRHAGQLERALKESALFELLLAWPTDSPGRPAAETALPASTRLARDYIHAHIAQMPTVADVAAHCRVGVRALDRGFRKHLGASPWQYMLELRLQAVHEDLLASRHGGTVTEVAMHWGFSNLGTFAARYREHFGELPSESLRKARSSVSLQHLAAAPEGQFRFRTARTAAGSQSA